MSLRDYLAGQMAPALLQTLADQNSVAEACARVARFAYDFADAMLAEREKRNG
jgi:hypothetical protein